MEITHEIVNDINVLHLEGKLTINNAQDFLSHMDTLIKQDPKKFLLEMSDLDFIDSTGLGTIILISKRISEGQCQLRFSNLKPKILNIIELTMLDSIFTIYNTQEEALKDY